ncbi:extensin [Brachypodium distachyon]|uniref:Extensin domain-containing protein n=1 Tax=Brachypodium distachyon TaxID=15368 RepID=A0A0Q3GKS8_BRADI|nr:extensin [Brachypodium distachyon]KQK11037.1 hypothetical protein BRADI_2g57740v3 [Brachypodium distachyon]|eukprot:XP_003564849.2 extensin [Brachypodium distachyon]
MGLALVWMGTCCPSNHDRCHLEHYKYPSIPKPNPFTFPLILSLQKSCPAMKMSVGGQPKGHLWLVLAVVIAMFAMHGEAARSLSPPSLSLSPAYAPVIKVVGKVYCYRCFNEAHPEESHGKEHLQGAMIKVTCQANDQALVRFGYTESNGKYSVGITDLPLSSAYGADSCKVELHAAPGGSDCNVPMELNLSGVNVYSKSNKEVVFQANQVMAFGSKKTFAGCSKPHVLPPVHPYNSSPLPYQYPSPPSSYKFPPLPYQYSPPPSHQYTSPPMNFYSSPPPHQLSTPPNNYQAPPTSSNYPSPPQGYKYPTPTHKYLPPPYYYNSPPPQHQYSSPPNNHVAPLVPYQKSPPPTYNYKSPLLPPSPAPVYHYNAPPPYHYSPPPLNYGSSPPPYQYSPLLPPRHLQPNLPNAKSPPASTSPQPLRNSYQSPPPPNKLS